MHKCYHNKIYILILIIWAIMPLKCTNNNNYNLWFNSNINNNLCLEVHHKWSNKCMHKESRISHSNNNSNNNSNSNSNCNSSNTGDYLIITTIIMLLTLLPIIILMTIWTHTMKMFCFWMKILIMKEEIISKNIKPSKKLKNMLKSITTIRNNWKTLAK